MNQKKEKNINKNNSIYQYFSPKKDVLLNDFIKKIIQEIIENLPDNYEIKKIIKIQKCFRGYICRLYRLPLIMYKIQKCLQNSKLKCSTDNEDGRINSCHDENMIINILQNFFHERIKKSKIRAWYDILAYDSIYGWIPINIKTTTTLSHDNTGNLAMCVYAYTNEELNFTNFYSNGEMSQILIDNIKKKNYNTKKKKDYYFVVVNKKNTNQIIINSVKGLQEICPNNHNLPFQICWNTNQIFMYEPIQEKIKKFISCVQKPKLTWKEVFLNEIRELKI